MGDREILGTYSNSASKNTSETDIFPHGPKSLLTSVMYQNIPLNCGSYVTYLFNVSLNLFLPPDKSLIVFGKWL